MTILHRPGAAVHVLFALLLFSPGCTDEQATDDDDTADDDTADDDTHEPGCITINGEVPGYAVLQDAVNAAVGGDVISICPGEHLGSAVVEKPLTILGEDAQTTVVEGDINEMTLTIRNTSGVHVSGLTLRSTRNAIVVEDSSDVLIENVVADDSGQYGVEVDGSELTLTDSTLSNHPMAAIVAVDSTLTVERCTISDIVGYGIRLAGSQGTIADSEVLRVSMPAETDGHDGACIHAEESTGTVTVSGSLMEECERVGIYGLYTDLDVTDCTVTDTLGGVVGAASGANGSVVSGCTIEQATLYGIALTDQDSEVSSNAVSAADPGDNSLGIIVGNPDGTFVVQDNQVSGYGRIGIWVQYPYTDPPQEGGTATLSGNTVIDIDIYGLLVTALDQATVSLNEVRGIRWGGELDDEGAYPDGFGLYVSAVEDLALSQNQVSDVDVVGLLIGDSTFTSEEDVVAECYLFGIYVMEASGSFAELSMEGNAISAMNVLTAEVELSQSSISNTLPGVPPDQWGEANPYEYSGYGLYASGSQLRLDGSTFDTNDYMHLDLDETDLDVADSTFTGRVEYAIYASYVFGAISSSTFDQADTAIYLSSVDPDYQLGDLAIEDCSFGGVGNGLYANHLAGTLTLSGCHFDSTTDVGGYLGDGYGIYAADYSADGAVVALQDNTFTSLANSAVYAYGVELDISGSTGVDGVANERPALALDYATGTVAGVSVVNGSGYGIQVQGSDLTIEGNDLLGAENHNLYVNSSTVVIQDNHAISQGKASGIRLEGTTGGSIVDNVIHDNEEYGISCSSPDVVLSSCANDMSGNLLGDILEENGCHLDCSIH